MQEHMNQFQKTFITMAAEYTEHVRREIDAANKKVADKTNDEDTIIHLEPTPVTLEDKVRTANLLMVTIDRMQRENGNRVPFAELHTEAEKPETVSFEDMVQSFVTEMFRSLVADANDVLEKQRVDGTIQRAEM